MSLALPRSRAASVVCSGGKLAVLVAAALAAFACNGTPPTQPPANTNSAANTNSGRVGAMAVATDPLPNLGIKYMPPAGANYTKGLVVVESDLPVGTSLTFRIVIKRSDAGDVTKPPVTVTAGKNITTIPLVAADLGKVTEVSWKETAVDPAQWVFNRHKTFEHKQIGANSYAGMSYVTKLGEVECCPQDVTIRGIFTTPIGVRVYMQQ